MEGNLQQAVDTCSIDGSRGGPQFRPRDVVVLILGTPKAVPLSVGDS